MAPVDVERVYGVFNLFAVSPPRTSNSTSSGSGATQEPYIPTFFLALAAREVGFYPTTSAVHQFVKSVPTATAGAITFAAFLQFCEDVAYTNRPGRSAIYKMVDDLDTRGGGLISRRELFLLLTNGSADISDGEVDAVMELLDPTLCGYVELKDLAALLIEQCQHQRSLSRTSRSRSRPESSAQPTASVDPVGDQQPADRRHRHHHRNRTPQPAPEAERRERRKGQRQAGMQAGAPPQQLKAKRATSPGHDNREREADDEPAPRPPQNPPPSSSSSGAVAGAATVAGAAPVAAAGERDRSFKRTDIGSNGEAAYRKYGSLNNRADAFERTQTTMTVDVDCPPSVSGTAVRQKTREEGAVGMHSPSPVSRHGHATQKGSPQSPPPRGPAPSATAPLPLGPSSTGPASGSGGGGRDGGVQDPSAEPRQVPKPAVKEESGEDQHAGEDEGGAPQEDLPEDGDDETNYYSRVEGTTTLQPTKEGHSTESPLEAPQPAPGDATPVLPSNPPKTKETKTKCCTMF